MLIKIRNLSVMLFSVVLLLIAACKEKPESQHDKIALPKIDFWGSQPTSSLPFDFKYDPDSIIDFFYTIDNFKDNGNISELNSFNELFTDSTLFLDTDHLMARKESAYPYTGKGYFFKKLPDMGSHKVLLFMYQNREQENYLPYVELQVFDKDKNLVDKMIVAGGFTEDCTWNRSFSIDKDYRISITDTESCFNTEKEKIVDEKTVTHLYRLQENGHIAEIEKKVV